MILRHQHLRSVECSRLESNGEVPHSQTRRQVPRLREGKQTNKLHCLLINMINKFLFSSNEMVFSLVLNHMPDRDGRETRMRASDEREERRARSKRRSRQHIQQLIHSSQFNLFYIYYSITSFLNINSHIHLLFGVS